MDDLQPFVLELHLGSPLLWLGLVLSALGVGLAWRTLRKTKSAAEATTEAISGLKDSLARVDRVAACSRALVALGEVKRLQRSSNWEILPDRYSDLRPLLVEIRSARPALSSEHNRGLQTVLAQLGVIEDQIERFLRKQESEPDVARINQVVSAQADRINEIVVEIRHTVGGRNDS